MIESFDLRDNQLIAMAKSGPHFTRQAVHGDQFDQSRIDRSYNNNRGMWMEFVREVIHDTSQSLSDHHPCLIRIAMKPMAKSNLKKSSYHKLDVLELEVDNTRVAIQQVWEE